jgi:hypothetical protein
MLERVSGTSSDTILFLSSGQGAVSEVNVKHIKFSDREVNTARARHARF